MPLDKEPDRSVQFSHLINAAMASSSAEDVGNNQHQSFQQSDGNMSRKRDSSEISSMMLGGDVSASRQEPLLCASVAAAAAPLPPDQGEAPAPPPPQPQPQPPPPPPPPPPAAYESMPHNLQLSIGVGGPVSSGNTRARRIPCKARGMGDSHTSATAYFDIPQGLQHGAVLACTHAACSGSGRRFRYCQVCEVPVAKRNFQKRHSHGLVPVGDPMLMASANINRNHDDDQQADGKHRRSVSYDAADTLNQLCGAPGGNIAEPPNEKMAATTVSGSGVSSGSDEKPMCINLTSQEFQWLALYHNRPSIHDHSAMEKWMTSIIDTSERSAGNAPQRETVTPPTPPRDDSSVLPSFQVKNGEQTSITGPPPPASAAEPAPAAEPAQTLSSLPEALNSSNSLSGFGQLISSLASQHKHDQSKRVTMNSEQNSMFPPPNAKPQYETKILISKPAADEAGYETEQHSNGYSDDRKSYGSKSSEDATMRTTAGPSEEAKKPPQNLAEYVSRKQRVAARAAQLFSTGSSKKISSSAEQQDDQSQASSVATRPAIRRRRSVKDARQLMGLIKLSGMKENDFDEIF